MTPAELFAVIESSTFAAAVGFASGESHVVSAIETHRAYQALATAVGQERRIAGRVLKRIQSLAGLAIDNRFEHPYDIALATYYLALERKAPDLGGPAAEIIAGAPNTWWAVRLATHTLAENRSSTAVRSSLPSPTLYWAIRSAITPRVQFTSGIDKGFYSGLLRNVSFELVANHVTAYSQLSAVRHAIPQSSLFTSASFVSSIAARTQATAVVKVWEN